MPFGHVSSEGKRSAALHLHWVVFLMVEHHMLRAGCCAGANADWPFLMMKLAHTWSHGLWQLCSHQGLQAWCIACPAGATHPGVLAVKRHCHGVDVHCPGSARACEGLRLTAQDIKSQKAMMSKAWWFKKE